MPTYQIAIFDTLGGRAAVLRATLEARLRDLKLDPAHDVEFLDESQLDGLQPDLRRVGVLFSSGAAGAALEAPVRKLLDSPAVLIPAVTSLVDFKTRVPPSLYSTNGLELDPGDQDESRVASLVLELLGLLRKRRRLFVSYRRSESAAAAQQLYHALDERSFDVFLDTLSVRPADQFQDQLWHRMTDSDIVILLYTPSVLASGWVEKEIERASAMKITVLQIIWPDVPRDPRTLLFEPVYLGTGDFDPDHTGQLTASKVRSLCTLVESLRASSLARRESELVGTLQLGASKHSIVTSVQPSRYVDVHCSVGDFARVIPSVGVPDSEEIHAGALSPANGSKPSQVVLLYDAMNVTAKWNTHLVWLNEHLPVKSVKVFEVDKWLSTLCH